MPDEQSQCRRKSESIEQASGHNCREKEPGWTYSDSHKVLVFWGTSTVRVSSDTCTVLDVRHYIKIASLGSSSEHMLRRATGLHNRGSKS